MLNMNSAWVSVYVPGGTFPLAHFLYIFYVLTFLELQQHLSYCWKSVENYFLVLWQWNSYLVEFLPRDIM
jgi:hypothetical protein